MPESIRDFVMAHPLFDAHQHVSSVPDYAKQEPHFSALVSYASADLVTARGPVGVGERVLPPMDDPGYTSAFFELWRRSRATGYCRATERACRDLLGLEFREENADAITKAYAKFVGDDARASYCMVLQEKAGVVWGIKDSIHTPEATSDELYPGEFIRFNYRDDGLLCILSRDDVGEREAWWQRSIHSLDDLIDGLMQSISDCLATGKVTSFKIGVAYRRGLDFKDPTRHEAERALNRLMGVDVDATVQATSAAGLPSRQSRLSSEELRPEEFFLLVHEGTHVWQYQNVGNRYAVDAIGAQWFVKDEYNWQREIHVRNKNDWSDFNAEAQARFFEDLWINGILVNISGLPITGGTDNGRFYDANWKSELGKFEKSHTGPHGTSTINYTDIARNAVTTVRVLWSTQEVSG